MSSYQQRNAPQSRPSSHVFPHLHSSLPYTIVRDFAYPANHALHYGPPPNNSGLSTPASESRRLSDPALPSRDDSSRSWPTVPTWTSEDSSHAPNGLREQLPDTMFAYGGPPYSEDEDLHSPVVTTARHRKVKATAHERGQSLGSLTAGGAVLMGVNGDGSETYYMNEEIQGEQDADGPGGEIVTYGPDEVRSTLLKPNHGQTGRRRNSHSALLYRSRFGNEAGHDSLGSDDDLSDAEDHGRFSRSYSFTIASPDEEMHGKAVALFDFESEHENELPLTEGQIILVSYRHGAGWLVAEDPKTKESGLVPEEFVRLVRDIEGGLNGLSAQMDELFSPNSDNATTPIAAGAGSPRHEKKSSNGSNSTSGDRHPSIQSSFSTSSKDLKKYPLQKEKDDNPTPTLPSHPLKNEFPDGTKENEAVSQP